MNKFMFLFLAVCFFNYSVSAQAINLMGTVTSAITNAPLRGVSVTLKNNPQLHATTGVDGSYSLYQAVGITQGITKGIPFTISQSNKGMLEIGTAKVVIESYTLNGVLQSQGAVAQGYYIPLRSTLVKQSGSLSKATAFSDTLIFTLTGYLTAKKGITSPTGLNNIALQLAPLPTVTDIEGNVYHQVVIGTQTWMVENLKVIHYNDGTAIPTMNALNNPGYAWYDASTVGSIYGALYTLGIIRTGKLAPSGWHIPDSTEFATLINYLGGSSVAAYKLKEAGTAHWVSPNTGATNSSGFTALPGGSRLSVSSHNYDLGYDGFWWSSSSFNTYWNTCLLLGDTYTYTILNGQPQLYGGYSVRCIKN